MYDICFIMADKSMGVHIMCIARDVKDIQPTYVEIYLRLLKSIEDMRPIRTGWQMDGQSGGYGTTNIYVSMENIH